MTTANTPGGRSTRANSAGYYAAALLGASRQGYLNLLATAPPRHADTPAMVAARERFLGGGGYCRWSTWWRWGRTRSTCPGPT